VLGADDPAHPAVRYLHDKAGSHYVGGRLIGLQAPNHYDFRERRHSPNELKALYRQWGWDRIVAFQRSSRSAKAARRW
jgi:sulfate adenylyltransferase